MTRGHLTFAGSAAIGIVCALTAGLTLHSRPPPPEGPCFIDIWNDAEAQLNHKSNRLPLRVSMRVKPYQPAPMLPPYLPPEPEQPPRDLVQLAPTILAVRPVATEDLCTRHGLRKVWINRRHWRCR